MSSIKVFDPTIGSAKDETFMAPRLETLKEARIGVIWNSQPHGDTIINHVIDNLSKKWGCKLVAFLEKPYIGNKAPDSFFDELVSKQVNIAIAGVGD